MWGARRSGWSGAGGPVRSGGVRCGHRTSPNLLWSTEGPAARCARPSAVNRDCSVRLLYSCCVLGQAARDPESDIGRPRSLWLFGMVRCLCLLGGPPGECTLSPLLADVTHHVGRGEPVHSPALYSARKSRVHSVRNAVGVTRASEWEIWGVHIVHTLGVGLGRGGAGLARIPHVSGESPVSARAGMQFESHLGHA
jgi:hypothetical protein